jgi:hypothetical protein
VTAQVTFWLVELLTVAVNCCSVNVAGQELPASSAYKVADPGLTVTVTVAFVATVSVSVGVVCVSVAPVPWTWKLNVPVVALPTVTVNPAAAAVGVTIAGAMMHVPGAPDVHSSVTLPLYPFNAVSVPFHTMS